MAHSGSGDKTEKATPHKKREARKKGQVARSRDLAAAAGVVIALKLIMIQSVDWLADFRKLFYLAFADLGRKPYLDNAWSQIFPNTMVLLIEMVLPLVVIPLLVIAVSLFPEGWVFSTENIGFKISRINPAAYFKKLFTADHWIEIAKTIVKAIILGLMVYYCTKNALHDFFSLQGEPLDEAIVHAMDITLDVLLSFVSIFVLFALIDLPLQVFMHMKKLMMSKQDIKDEYKSTEGRPEVKQRIRQIQRQLAKRSVRKSLQDANVVIMNPTHYAVALRYDPHRAEAPYIVAKGMDEMALFIKSLATQHKIEVLEIPPLARAIYHTTQVNQQIPTSLYRAVAQVLTYVLQLKAFQEGKRHQRPNKPDRLDVPEKLTQPQPNQ